MNLVRPVPDLAQQPAQIPPVSFPASRDEVTEAWLRDALRAHPRFLRDPIRRIQLTDLGDGIGQLSVLTLAHLRCASGRRLSLVIKLQASVPEMHDVALRYGHYESEVNFYREMAAAVPLQTPEIYISAMDQRTGRVLVIMEALCDWHSPNQLEGASAAQIEIAVQELAGLAASFWGAAPSAEFPWLRTAASPQYATLPEDLVACVPGLLARFEAGWPADAARALTRLSDNFRRIQQAIINGRQALSHWDFRVENLFFGPEGELAVIDWQLMHMNNPANDLAYLLSTNVTVELRREIEADMMALFLRGLKEHGVTGYGMAELVTDYRLALLGITPILIIGGANADVGNDRSRALFATMGTRMLSAIDDWAAVDVIETLPI